MSYSDKIHSNNKSGFRGVHPLQNGRYKAVLKINREQIHLGCFDTPEEASNAYWKELYSRIPEEIIRNKTRREIRKKYYENNKEYFKNWCQNNREKLRKTYKRFGLKLRLDVITAYGGKCECCGEERTEFLTIDHIDGNGAEHRKKIGYGATIYKWLRRNNFPKENFRLLCYNCNCSRGCYGYCPHEKEREFRKKGV